ncbi:DUF5682 family protein [Planctomicrobium sp. SH527]|uniref:DUF5682 family protein n=1 Tax=Planctomicrobium sp. SH527 TaxID=3448123 RepID=UPI003F5B1802
MLERLCDTYADVVYFPVRHHSPVAAALVETLIHDLRPAAVLIEGPSDFNEHFSELFLAHELPIAIYSYYREGTDHGGAYYPFCEYSPEWTALQAAHQTGTRVAFIDIPWPAVARRDQVPQRFADGELRRGRYVESLCQKMHVENFDDLWDQLIEAQPPMTDAEAAAELLVVAARAGIETLSATLFDRVSQHIDEESSFNSLTGAFGHLFYLFCHDEALGTTQFPKIGELLNVAFGRTLWVLESLGQSTGDAQKQLRGMCAVLDAWQRANTIISLSREDFSAILHRVENDSRKPPLIRGAAAGILWSIGMANDEQILADLMQFAIPAELGDFLTGLFGVAREVAQRQPQLVLAIDTLLNGFGSQEFQEALPSLRLAFTYFTPREQHFMLQTLFETLGLKSVAPLGALAVDTATAAEALTLEERLFDMMAQYGLEAPNE